MTFSEFGIKGIVRLIVELGILPFLALYLIWNATERGQKQLDSISVQLQQHNIAMEELKGTAERQTNQNELLIDISRQLCINSGRTYEDRSACWTLNGRVPR